MICMCSEALVEEADLKGAQSVFLKGALAAIALVGCGLGIGGAETRARCMPGLLLSSMAITTLLGVGSESKG